MLCPVAIGYLLEELGQAAAQSSVPCLGSSAGSVPLCSLEFVTWMVSWTVGELLFSEVHVEHFFFPNLLVRCLGFVCSWALNVCKGFNYALTNMGMLREAEIVTCSLCYLFIVYSFRGRHIDLMQASLTACFSQNHSWMLKLADFCKAFGVTLCHLFCS